MGAVKRENGTQKRKKMEAEKNVAFFPQQASTLSQTVKTKSRL
jgi:hypothetical protein